MVKFTETEVVGWKHVIRGMRNPMNSWDKSDSTYKTNGDLLSIGENDLKLMTKLRNAGTDHRKYLRMIVVYTDITAPLYWWKEFDTYKVGTVTNSCSTMHKIHDKEFTLSDFSHEHLTRFSLASLKLKIKLLNYYREKFNKTKNKMYWWQMIQLLPSSYNQTRTVMLNYEVLNNIFNSRAHHKQDEWSIDFMNWINNLPYSKILIKGED